MNNTGTSRGVRARDQIGDITDEEIQEWKASDNFSVYFAGLAAEAIRNGTYHPGQEIYGTQVRQWLCNPADGMSPKTFESAMNILAEKNMVRIAKQRSIWDRGNLYYVAGEKGERKTHGGSLSKAG